ncbi:MAG: hypothetical protein GXP06_11035 [Alphaproteobacteria bacterium]|nr:hypothetical protein [Alphaproteobacteria bacterium]
MKERRPGLAGIAPLAIGLSGFAMLLVGGCAVTTIWVGMSDEHLAGLIPLFGMPIATVLFFTLYGMRKMASNQITGFRRVVLSIFGLLLGVPLIAVGLSVISTLITDAGARGALSDTIPALIFIITAIVSGITATLFGVAGLIGDRSDNG